MVPEVLNRPWPDLSPSRGTYTSGMRDAHSFIVERSGAVDGGKG